MSKPQPTTYNPKPTTKYKPTTPQIPPLGGRALKNSSVNCFSEGASRRAGIIKPDGVDLQPKTHHPQKKPDLSIWFSSHPWRLHQEQNYFLCFFSSVLSAIDTIKLTIAPIEAKSTVLKTSAESKFGTTLKKVPPAVPIRV